MYKLMSTEASNILIRLLNNFAIVPNVDQLTKEKSAVKTNFVHNGRP